MLWLTGSRSEFEATVHYEREVEEAGAADHIAATITKQSEEMPALSPLSRFHTIQDLSPGGQ